MLAVTPLNLFPTSNRSSCSSGCNLEKEMDGVVWNLVVARKSTSVSEIQIRRSPKTLGRSLTFRIDSLSAALRFCRSSTRHGTSIAKHEPRAQHKTSVGKLGVCKNGSTSGIPRSTKSPSHLTVCEEKISFPRKSSFPGPSMRPLKRCPMAARKGF
jgi:hypothetical protein